MTDESREAASSGGVQSTDAEATPDESASSNPSESEAEDAEEAESSSPVPNQPDVEGISFFDEPQGSIMAPNGAQWRYQGSYDVEALLEKSSGSEAGFPAAGAIDCAQDWDSTSALWLRTYNDGNGGDYFDDEYQDGPTAGPTCFGDTGGTVTAPEYRLVNYVCQTANTTARTLFSAAGGGPAVWTPEYTTGDQRECFTFEGEEVRAFQTDLTEAE
ncbi:hypothetical protein [Nesterenkonia sp. Act20]|uniref:hypothetical protein n=1 Tax=Nesterenkonia sp. Act20 TaxID=1483432 RepID=UPI001C44B39B|nr:hypothetical protein [Nesterenkonia sp. Act20]